MDVQVFSCYIRLSSSNQYALIAKVLFGLPGECLPGWCGLPTYPIGAAGIFSTSTFRVRTNIVAVVGPCKVYCLQPSRCNLKQGMWSYELNTGLAEVKLVKTLMGFKGCE